MRTCRCGQWLFGDGKPCPKGCPPDDTTSLKTLTAHELTMMKVQARVDQARLYAENNWRRPLGAPPRPMPPAKHHYVLHVGYDLDGEIWQCVPIPKKAGTVSSHEDSGAAIRYESRIVAYQRVRRLEYDMTSTELMDTLTRWNRSKDDQSLESGDY